MGAIEFFRRFTGGVHSRLMRTGLRFGNRWLTRRGQLNIYIPRELAVIGRVKKIEYDCLRDGKSIDAIHTFSPGSRPLLAAGTRNGEVFLVGDAYRFTDRGFVDLDKAGDAIVFDEDTGRISRLLE